MITPALYFKNRYFRRGFSMIEILVTVALLTVIILGLVAMFNQTRRAFTSSITQVDVLESGRSTADLIAREMEQMTPSGAGNVTNFFVYMSVPQQARLVQPLNDPNDFVTNSFQSVCFVTRLNTNWSVIGYKLLPPITNNQFAGIGTLYRYSLNNIAVTNANFNLLAGQTQNFVSVDTLSPNVSRLIDGVVDFRIRAYDTNGNLFPFTNRFTMISSNYFQGAAQADYFYQFTSNSVPAYVELELGILEDRTLARYQALASVANGNVSAGTPPWNYLQSHAGQVHIFRQRIPIRNVNPAAFQ